MQALPDGNKRKKRDRIGVVLYLAYIALLAASLLIVLRILFIQVFYQPEPKLEAALTPRSSKTVLEPRRGRIYDTKGRLMATSNPYYELRLDCMVATDANGRVPEVDTVWQKRTKALCRTLASLIPGENADKMYNTALQGRKNGERNVKICNTLIDHQTLRRIKADPVGGLSSYVTGLKTEQKYKREYPYGELARRVIGYVKDESTNVDNTHLGLEGKFDHDLHGTDGYQYTRSTDYGRSILDTDSAYVAAIDGKDLYCTIDMDYQGLADAALRKEIEGEEDIDGACVILMEVSTGAIRAMVNLKQEDDGRFLESFNYAIGRKGPPGSVFKTVTLVSLLNDGYVHSLEETLPATNGRISGTSITDTHIPEYAARHGTREISIYEGFKISSNYVFGELAVRNYGREFGHKSPDQFLSNLHTYKLGEVFDFDLKGMASPVIPSPETRYWTDTDLANMAYGYSTDLTPLHIITFYNAIANKGKMMKPYLAERVVRRDGKTTAKYGPSVLNSAMCSRAVADTVTRALTGVTEDGTGRRLRRAKVPVAGKTGTAFVQFENGKQTDEYGRRQRQATFVGYFPADNPKYSVICTLFTKPSHRMFQGGNYPAQVVLNLVNGLYDIDPCFREEIEKGK